MNKPVLLLLFMALLVLSCQPSQTQGEASDGKDEVGVSAGDQGSVASPGPLPGQAVDRQLNIAPADFQPQSAARGLAQILTEESPAGKSVPLHYMAYEPGAVVFPETGEAALEVDELAVILRDHPGLFVDIAVYASGDQRAERLALERAFFIKNRLIEDLVEAERIDTKAFSTTGGDERVEIRVVRN